MAGPLEGALAGYAGYLARAVRPRLVLAGSGLPPRSEWPDRLAGDGGFEEAEATARVEVEPAALAAEVDVREAALERGQGVRLMSEYEGLEAELDRFCASSALDFLKREGIDLAVGRHLHPGTLRRDLGVLPAFTKLLDALLAMLVEDGILAADGGELRVTATAGRIEPPAALRERLDTLYPEQHGLVWMVDHCVRHYGPALRGEIPAIGVLYPEGRTDLLDEADRDTVTSNFEGLYIRLLSETVAGLAPEAGRGRPLRILEVGGGTGSLTRPLLASLAGRSFTYLFTDLGKAFVRAAEAEAAKLGITGVSFRTLDIGQDLETQGLAPYEFDVVVGLNVVHATRSLRQTVRNLRRMLAPGGWLGLIENVRPSRCVDLIWGLAEGWWYFEDADLRTTSPLVGLATWERVLRDVGLESVTSWPRPGSRGSRQEIGLVLGRQASHLSLADPAYRERLAALGAERTRRVRATIHLAESLEAQGAEITLAPAPPDGREDTGIASAVRTARELHGALHGALLAKGIGPQALQEVETVSSLDGADLDLLVLSPPPPASGVDSACLGAFAEARSAAGRPTRALFWNRPPESAEEAAEVLGQALSRELPQLWVEVTPQPAAAGGALPTDPAESTARPSGGSRPHSPVEHPAASPVALQVAHLWQEILGTEVSLTDNFFDLGGDSLVALSLTSRLRGELGVELSMRHILEAPTVEALAQLVERERARSLRTVRTHRAQLPPTVVEIQPGDSARLPFFTVHAAGGNVLCYYELARHLKQERPVYALEAPGLDGERTIFNRLEDLAAFHVGAVREFQPHGPYLLGGWSAGGTVAFEMAQQLRRLGERVLLVALMDTYAPKAGEHLDELGMLLWQAWRFRLTVTAEELELLGSYEERVDYLVRRGMESGVIPADVVDATQARRLLAIELSTLQAMLNYRPVVLDGELAYFRCEEGTDFGDFERLFPHVNQIDHAEAWREYSTRPMQVFVVPGHHQALMSEPGVAVLAQQLADRIASLELAETD
jgi:thioesterase domain-containing protein/SAM-dependent methyltransferase/acyl carrier protein